MLPMGRGDGVNGVWGVRVPMVPPPPLIQYQENALRQSRTFYADWEGIADAAVGNPRAGAIPTTGTSPSSSASSPSGARISAFGGPPTMSASTAPAVSRSTTRSSEI